jgi:site-specific recombinase XerD
LKQGVPLKVVSERLGHSSISITADIYSHVTPGMQESAAKLFDDAISTKYNEIEKYVTIP